jgi:hypothetical protein
VVADGLRGHVVGERRHRPGGRRVEDVGARRGQRKDLVVDARSVHVGETLGTEVGEPAHHVPRPGCRAAEVEAPQAVEAAVAAPVAHQPAVEVQHLGWGEGLLGGDAAVSDVPTGGEVRLHRRSPFVVRRREFRVGR